MAKAGHNSLAKDQLKTIVERVERLMEERAGLNSDIRDIFAEAKGNGFDNRTIRECIRLRQMDTAERDEHEHLRDLYMHGLDLV